jgi:hypothetical protein
MGDSFHYGNHYFGILVGEFGKFIFFIDLISRLVGDFRFFLVFRLS